MQIGCYTRYEETPNFRVYNLILPLMVKMVNLVRMIIMVAVVIIITKVIIATIK